VKHLTTLLSVFLFLTISVKNTFSQSSNDGINSHNKSSCLSPEKLIGTWISADSIKTRVEFIDNGYELILKFEKDHPYYFPKDSAGNVTTSGYFPMWPPPGCNLEFISHDSIVIRQAPFFDLEAKRVLFIKQQNDKRN